MSKVFGVVILLAISVQTSAQMDTIRMAGKQILLISDSVFIATNDTLLIVPAGTEYQIVDNRYILNKGFYDSAYSKAQRSKLTQELYGLLIVNRPPKELVQTNQPVKSESFFKPYVGKRIRNIHFVSVDILEGSVYDTTITATSRIGKLSNKFHQDTRTQVIRKNLLFEEGEYVDPLEIADSERVIRSLPFIEDNRIRLVLNPDDLESVDAIVIYKDRFPLSINFGLERGSTLRLGFTNRSILGSGNEFGGNYLYSRSQRPHHGYDLRYTIRNIENTFIDGSIYRSDNYLGESSGITFSRNFVSRRIKNYGEITLEREIPIRDLTFADSVYARDFRSERHTYDLWAGRSFAIGKQSDINFGVRLFHDNYLERPTVKADSNELYHDRHLLVGDLSYSKTSFLKSKNIISFNVTEDIPEGFIFSFLYGRDWTEFEPRDYFGIKFNYSKYTDFGYISFNLESGYFANKITKLNEVTEMSTRYFTPLIKVRKAYSRIFTRLYFYHSSNLSIPQQQSLSGIDRIQYLRGEQIRGEKLFSVSHEYVVYQPWYLYGFRFATYAHAGMGQISESRIETPFSRMYFSFGGGVRVRNESLVFDTFELRFSFYPDPPVNSNFFYLRFTLSGSSFFQSPNISKPRVVGLNFR